MRFFKPYINGKPNPLLPPSGKSGVYAIKRRNKKGFMEVVYVGYSGSDVRKTLLRHFQVWNDLRSEEHKKRSRIERITYVNCNVDEFLVKCVLMPPSRAAKMEKSLILKHKPKDNTNKYLDFTGRLFEEDLPF